MIIRLRVFHPKNLKMRVSFTIWRQVVESNFFALIHPILYIRLVCGIKITSEKWRKKIIFEIRSYLKSWRLTNFRLRRLWFRRIIQSLKHCWEHATLQTKFCVSEDNQRNHCTIHKIFFFLERKDFPCLVYSLQNILISIINSSIDFKFIVSILSNEDMTLPIMVL
jgi:hypothetical protein